MNVKRLNYGETNGFGDEKSESVATAEAGALSRTPGISAATRWRSRVGEASSRPRGCEAGESREPLSGVTALARWPGAGPRGSQARPVANWLLRPRGGLLEGPGGPGPPAGVLIL